MPDGSDTEGLSKASARGSDPGGARIDGPDGFDPEGLCQTGSLSDRAQILGFFLENTLAGLAS